MNNKVILVGGLITVVQGLEINMAREKVAEANAKYFDGTKTFVNVKKRKLIQD